MSENIKESRWVWISSDDSIQRGQISLLALLEIPLALAHPHRPDGHPSAAAALAGIGGGGTGDVVEVLGE